MQIIREYGLVVDGAIIHPQNPFNTGDGLIHNPTAKQLEEYGWLPVTYEEIPTVDEGYHPEQRLISTDIDITVTYEVVKDAPVEQPSLEELKVQLAYITEQIQARQKAGEVNE